MTQFFHQVSVINKNDIYLASSFSSQFNYQTESLTITADPTSLRKQETGFKKKQMCQRNEGKQQSVDEGRSKRLTTFTRTV